jgi:nucleoside 2-deoxyribosyltransferase
MNIYLAGPIDSAADDSHNWKKLLVKVLGELEDPLDTQWTAFDPAAPWVLFNDFEHTPYRSAWIESVNREVIRHCDIVVAYQPSTVMTVGTPMELADADTQGKTIIVFSDVKFGKAVYLQNRVEKRNFFTIDEYGDLAATMDAVAGAVVNAAEDLHRSDPWSRSKQYTDAASSLFARADRNAPRGVQTLKLDIGDMIKKAP